MSSSCTGCGLLPLLVWQEHYCLRDCLQSLLLSTQPPLPLERLLACQDSTYGTHWQVSAQGYAGEKLSVRFTLLTFVFEWWCGPLWRADMYSITIVITENHNILNNHDIPTRLPQDLQRSWNRISGSHMCWILESSQLWHCVFGWRQPNVAMIIEFIFILLSKAQEGLPDL